MLKYSTVLILMNLAFWANTQSYVYIERNETNAELFDENVPFGFMNLLKTNVTDLDYYGLSGMSDDVLTNIRAKKNDESVLCFVGPDNSVIPLKDHLGEDSIATMEDGTLTFVYPAPDSIHIDLEGITGILLEIDPSQKGKALHQQIRRIDFIKQYKGETRADVVCSLKGEALFQFDAFKQLNKMNAKDTRALTSKTEISSLWNYLRERSLQEMEGRKSGSTVSDSDIRNSGRLIFFPGEYWPCSSWNKMNLRHPMVMYQLLDLGVELKYLENYDCEKDLPFRSFYDGLSGLTVEVNDAITAQLDSCFMVWYDVGNPWLDEYGLPIVEVAEDGTEMYLYDQPDPIYYWVDASDIEVYAMEDLVYDSILNRTTNQLERLIFTQSSGKEMTSKVIFHLDLVDNEDVVTFLPEGRGIVLQETAWWLKLKSSLSNRKLRYRNSKKREMIRLKEQINLTMR